MSSDYLKLSGVRFGYNPERSILDGFNLTIPKGGGVIVSGPVGSGKTTMVNLLIGRLKPQAGEVLVYGKSIGDIPPHDRSRFLSSWGIVLEEDTLLKDRSVRDNIKTAVKLSASRVKPSASEINALLRTVGLIDKRKQRPSELSRGERRLLQLSMACLRNPLFFIWDDPDSGLDETAIEIAMEIISKKHLAGMTLLMTTSRPDCYSDTGWPLVEIGGGDS
jgi:ABC-type multidrug transport system ATPase subunit